VQAIKDLIPMSKRTLGSDRIAKLISFALILGLFQFISVVKAPPSNAASTGGVTSFVVSTGGGGGLGQSNCPTGSLIYEVHSTQIVFDGGNAMSQVYANCANLNSEGTQINAYTQTTSAFGSATGSLANQTCGLAGSTRAVIGARVYKTANGFAAGIQLICRTLPNTLESSEYWTGQVLGNGGSGNNWSDLKCPVGTVALGLYMYSGSILDKFGFNCGPVTGATQSAITSVTLSLTSKTYPYSSNLYVASIVGGSGAGDFLITSISNGTASGCAYSALTISSNSSGTCTVTVTKTADTNYAARSRTETFTFSKATLSVTASSPSVTFGDPIPTISPTYSGFVNSENASSSSFTTGLTAPTCTTVYTTTSAPGSAPTTSCSGGSAANYTFSFVSGNVLISNPLSTEFDRALTLNGTNQEAKTPDNSALDITGNFTGEAWVFPTNANARGTVFGKWLSYMLQTEGGTWRYWLHGTNAWAGVNTGIPVIANEWVHVAFTRAASSNQANFYINGQLVYTGTADSVLSGQTINNSSSDFTIGSHNSSTDFFAGRIDEVRIWNVVRSQSEIQTDLKTWGLANASGLVAYYDFNELSSSILFNRSSNNANLLGLTTINSPTIANMETTTVSQAYTVVTFPRTYLVAGGGWRSPANRQLRVLAVGGGGGGGFNTGGGGSGGGITTGFYTSNTETLSVTVGVGGVGAIGNGSSQTRTQTDGTSSIFANLTASGGNFGKTFTTSAAGGLAVNGYGAGGAGAASSGSNASNGSIGFQSNITGTNIHYGGGGGGGGWSTSNAAGTTCGGIGQSGGGNGASKTSGCTFNSLTATSGTAGLGGGGGGARWRQDPAGNGGSGVVIIAYITDTPTILTQPLSDTTTAGIVETFTITTSAAPAPLTKSVQWQFSTDTITGTTGWANAATGSGFTTDTFTTVALTKAMNKYRYRAIVTFSDTSTIMVQETSTVVILTINDSITITSDTSTITRKYGDAQSVRTIVYSGGTTNTGAVGTSTSHTLRGQVGNLASGRIVLDTSTSTVVFRVDTRTAVGTYVETVTVTDFKGATASYAQRVVVNPADTLTVTPGTPATLTYTGSQAVFTETVTVTGLVKDDVISGFTYNYSASSQTCANGGLCNVGEIGPGGGYVFYVSPTVINVAAGISTGGVYLEAAPVAAQGTAEYGCTGTNTPGTSYSVGSGAANTLAIITACATAGIAARVTSNLTYAGFSDWFMPSLDEMSAIYNNLYNKTPSLGGFTGLNYGSSSQGTNGNGYQAYWWFGAGSVSGQTNKNLVVAYRPVRAFSPIYTSEVNYGPSATKPTGAGTYKIEPSAITFSNGLASNYVNIKYETSILTINKAKQDTLTITSKFAPFNGASSTMKLTTLGGNETGTVTYSIATGGTASACSVNTNVLTVTSAGTCNLVATKAATLNYLITYSDTVTVTFSLFVSNQQTQTQLYPTMLPINGANGLETTTVTIPAVISVTSTGAGSYTIVGTGFTGASSVLIGGTPVTIASSNSTTINITGAAGLTGPLFIECSDGRMGPVPFWLIL
jgi:hypothetical protein